MFREHYKSFVYIFVVVIVVFVCLLAIAPPATVILVRHAEKAGTGTNPDLTPDGLARADAVVSALNDAGVRAIFVTDFCRTAQTAQPLAMNLGLPLQVQSVAGAAGGLGGCTPTIDATVNTLGPDIGSPAELVDPVLEKEADGSVLVVGHSNTLPEIVATLGAKPLCPDYFPLVYGDCRIPDGPNNAEYDNLFVVQVPRWYGEPTIARVRYGDHDQSLP